MWDRKKEISEKQRIVAMEKMGNKKSSMKVIKHKNKDYWTFYTGYTDLFGDEIILTIYPDEKCVTDRGYTDYALQVYHFSRSVHRSKLMADTHGVKIANTYKQTLSINYENDWKSASKKLISCILDIYAISA